jgi:hypothetical protein
MLSVGRGSLLRGGASRRFRTEVWQKRGLEEARGDPSGMSPAKSFRRLPTLDP